MIEQKRKYELIHKATVKSQYYKELNKKEEGDETPDYVKEVYTVETSVLEAGSNLETRSLVQLNVLSTTTETW